MDLLAKSPKIELNTNDIWGDDKLDRKQVAEKFTNLVESITEPFVISINAQYGMGKTYFLERWQQQLPDDKFATLFFNAWQTDFHEHAFLPFIHSLITQIKEKKLLKDNPDALNRFENVCKAIFSSIAINAMTLYTGGLVNSDTIKDGTKAAATFENTDIFEDFTKRQENLDKFKTILKEIVEVLGLKLVIFVDELERCRPTYAVELLESIKHLFDIPGIIFILGIDRSQLKYTVAKLYGREMDSDGYLRRFIDIELNLPTPSVNNYIRQLYDNYKLDEFLTYEDSFNRGGRNPCYLHGGMFNNF